MNKALKILEQIYQQTLTTVFNKKDIEFIQEAIEELEEAMKPKSCLSCRHCNKEYQLMSNPPQYELGCGVFKTVFVDNSKQHCSNYKPKDMR